MGKVDMLRFFKLDGVDILFGLAVMARGVPTLDTAVQNMGKILFA